MDSKDSAAPSPAPEMVPPPSEEDPTLSPSPATSSAASPPSPGSVSSQSDFVLESSGEATPVAADGSEGFDAASGLEWVFDESSDSEGAILSAPVAEDDAVPAATPPAAAEREVFGDSVASPEIDTPTAAEEATLTQAPAPTPPPEEDGACLSPLAVAPSASPAPPPVPEAVIQPGEQEPILPPLPTEASAAPASPAPETVISSAVEEATLSPSPVLSLATETVARPTVEESTAAAVPPPPLPAAGVDAVDDDGNQSLGSKGETLAVIDGTGAVGPSSENSEVEVAVDIIEQKDSSETDEFLAAAAAPVMTDPVADGELKLEAVKLELTNLPGEKVGSDYSAVDDKTRAEPLLDGSNLVEPVKVESTDRDIDEEALLKPLEAESGAVDSVEIATSNQINLDAPGETESKVAEVGENVDVETAEERISAEDANLETGSEVVKPAEAEGLASATGQMAGSVEASNKFIDQNLAQPINVTASLNNVELGNKDAEIPDSKKDGTLGPTVEQEVKSATDDSQATEDDKVGMGRFAAKLEEEDDLASDGPTEAAAIRSNETAQRIIKEMIEGAYETNVNSDYTQSADGQIVTDSEEEIETDEEDVGKELVDSATLAAVLRAAAGSTDDGSFTFSSQDSGRVFTLDRPVGLGSSSPALKPAPARSVRFPAIIPSGPAGVDEEESDMNEEDRKLHEQVEQIRVKFLRLVQRLKHSPEDTVAAQVLYRLGLAEGIRSGRHARRTFDLENAKRKALELEAESKVDLNFACNILVIGKTGVGKSATINSIFGEKRAQINAFEAATVSVKEISGIVDGVKVRVIDTPGLRASAMEQSSNRKILSAIKKYTNKCPPDIVLYVDRLDTQTRDLNDLPLLRSITSTLGSSIWFNAIVALTHAASAPPDGPNGSPLSYEVFLAQRSHVVQHLIRQAAGDMRLMNPVALVENHPSCRRNKEGERVLPNGLSWRPQMLLLCYSSKILSEANSLLKLQDPSPGKLFGFRLRSPPLPFLLSSLLQSRVHPKLAADQGGDNGDSDLDLDDFSDAEADEDEDEYDQLPPFKPLRKAQIAKLTKEQRRAYFEEYDYRVKLLQKKQWKEEIRRMKEMKKKGKSNQDDFAYGDMAEDDQDAAPAAVPVPLPDMVLPPSFDCDNPVYRYRFLEPTSQLLTRPVLDTHSWDHDCGYDGVSIEHSLALCGCFPAGVTVQITKDKKDFNIHLDSSVAMKHGQNASTLACFEIQPIGRQLGYTLRGETKFKNLKKNKTTGGISVTFLGENVATGLKLEDQLSVGKRFSLVASTGAVRAQGDMAYGANLEARLRDKEFPIGQALTTLGLSLMKWRSDLALGANVQSQFPIGRNSKMAVRVGLNNKLSGQITVKASTSEQLQIGLLAILPIAASMLRIILSGESYSAH